MLWHNFLLLNAPSAKLGCKQSLHLLVRDAGPKDHWVLSPEYRQDHTRESLPFLITSFRIMARLSGTDQEFELRASAENGGWGWGGGQPSDI